MRIPALLFALLIFCLPNGLSQAKDGRILAALREVNRLEKLAKIRYTFRW